MPTSENRVTLAWLAQAKRLGVESLECLGVYDLPGGGVGIPYHGEAGELLFVRTRGVPGSRQRFGQPAGVRLQPYGLHRLGQARRAGYLLLPEGESDCWAAWLHDVPALGLPGSNTAACLKAEHLAGVARLYVCREPDEGGETFVRGVAARLRQLRYTGAARELRLPEGVKDLADLHVRDPALFMQALETAILQAGPLPEPAPWGPTPTANGQGNAHTTAAEPRALRREDVATVADLEAAGSRERWLCPLWVPVGVLTALASEPGLGKTRFCADLVRRIKRRQPWPDGSEMAAPADALALWVVGDNHHDQMVGLAQEFDIADRVYLNALKADPFGGTNLDSLEDLAAFEERVRAVRPLLAIVDTVGNTTELNLSKQEDARTYYAPLQVIARKYECAVLCLTHLNAGGKFLGRRVLEKVRVAIQMTRPDATDDRRRLWVAKTYSRPPKPLGLLMRDGGNEYDDSPPSEPGGPEAPAPVSHRLQQVTEWLRGELQIGQRRVSHLRERAEEQQIAPKTLYAAVRALGVEEFTAEGRKWWRLAPDDELPE